MVVSSNYNLIPYPEHHYSIQPYISENALANQHPGQKSIERLDRFQQPRAAIKTGATHFDLPDNGYDFSRRLQYSAAGQVGRFVDIYA